MRRNKEAAKEASRHRETEGLGNALSTAIAQRLGHQEEQRRLERDLQTLQERKADIEAKLSADRRYAEILARRDAAAEKVRIAAQRQEEVRTELKRAMSEAWRSVLRDPIRNARSLAQKALQTRLLAMQYQLRAAAVESGHCNICDQDLTEEARRRLTSTFRHGGCARRDGCSHRIHPSRPRLVPRGRQRWRSAPAYPKTADPRGRREDCTG